MQVCLLTRAFRLWPTSVLSPTLSSRGHWTSPGRWILPDVGPLPNVDLLAEVTNLRCSSCALAFYYTFLAFPTVNLYISYFQFIEVNNLCMEINPIFTSSDLQAVLSIRE